MSETWLEQQKREMLERAESMIDERKNEEVKQQLTSLKDNKCAFCKAIIPKGNPLVRVTQRIYIQGQDNPFFKSKTYCDMNCKNGIKEPKEPSPKDIEERNPIPEGFEIVT